VLFRRGRFAAIAAAVIILGGSSLSRAETWKGKELEDLWRKTPWHVGPFRIQPAIVISNAGVDSNLYYSPSNPVKDFTVTAGPEAIIYLPVHRTLILSASASPQYVYYVKTAQERTWNYYLTGSAALNLRHVFLSFDWRYSDAREHWNYEIDIRPRRKEKGLGGSFLIQTSHRTSLEVDYKQEKYDYETLFFDAFNVPEQLDRKEQYADVLAYYQITSRTRFFLDGEYGVYTFDFADTAALKDSHSWGYYAGLEFSPTGRIRGKVRLGYKTFDLKYVEGQNFQGLVGDSQISVRLAKPFVLRASYGRDVNFSLWYNNPYFVSSTPGAGASLYLLKFLRLDYDYSFYRYRYPVAQNVAPGEDVKRLDEFQIHSVGLYFRIWKKTAIGIIGSRWVRVSNIASENGIRYFLGANLTYDF
jgi:hypothetical protein